MFQLIDNARFKASSSSNLINNLSEKIHRIKCKFGHLIHTNFLTTTIISSFYCGKVKHELRVTS